MTLSSLGSSVKKDSLAPLPAASSCLFLLKDQCLVLCLSFSLSHDNIEHSCDESVCVLKVNLEPRPLCELHSQMSLNLIDITSWISYWPPNTSLPKMTLILSSPQHSPQHSHVWHVSNLYATPLVPIVILFLIAPLAGSSDKIWNIICTCFFPYLPPYRFKTIKLSFTRSIILVSHLVPLSIFLKYFNSFILSTVFLGNLIQWLSPEE